jgi:hypothetical protein
MRDSQLLHKCLEEPVDEQQVARRGASRSHIKLWDNRLEKECLEKLVDKGQPNG